MSYTFRGGISSSTTFFSRVIGSVLHDCCVKVEEQESPVFSCLNDTGVLRIIDFILRATLSQRICRIYVSELSSCPVIHTYSRSAT